MSRKEKKIDHGFRELKWLLRRRLLAHIEPHTALDLYAGSGRILVDLYGAFQEIHAVEKDGKKYARLCQGLARLRNVGPNGRRLFAYCQDNRAFVRQRIAGIRNINLLDFDAYGDPHPLIQEVFRYWTPATRTAIAVTDAGRLAHGLPKSNKFNRGVE
jgi:hypothetical protein